MEAVVTEDGVRYAEAMGRIEMLAVRAQVMLDATRRGTQRATNIGHGILLTWLVLITVVLVGSVTGTMRGVRFDVAIGWFIPVVVVVPLYFEGKARRLAQLAPQWQELVDTAVVHVETSKRFPVFTAPADWAEDRLTALRARMTALLSVTPAFVYDFVEEVEDEMVGDDV